MGRRTANGSEVAMFWSGMFLGVFIGTVLMIPIMFVVDCSETVHAIDHRLAEKIKGDKPDIDIDVR